MTSDARIRETVARVRALVGRLAAPDPALLRLTATADAHTAALDPQLAVLAPQTFGSLSISDVHGPDAAAAAERRRRMRVHADGPLPRSAGQRIPAAGAQTDAVNRRARTSSAAPETTTSSRAGAPAMAGGSAARHPRPALPLAASPPSIRATQPDAAPPPAQRAATQRGASLALPLAADPHTVDLGGLAERAQRTRTSAPDNAPGRDDRQTGLRVTHASTRNPSTTEPPRAAAGPRTLLPLPLTAAPAPDRNTADGLRAGATRALKPGQNALPAGEGGPADSSTRYHDPGASARTASPQFLFDPLAPAPSAGSTDDMVASRIEALLREQAGRHGVDLS